MYPVKDKKAAIREVQGYLVTISQIEDSMPHVTVDGFYDEQTRLAVVEFQKLRGLTPTGAIDFETFDTIYSYHKQILDSKKKRSVTHSISDYPLRRGDSNDSVLHLNAKLRMLSEYYEIKMPNDDDYFSSETLEGVVYMKGVFGLEESEEVDAVFMSMLSDEILARQKFLKAL